MSTTLKAFTIYTLWASNKENVRYVEAIALLSKIVFDIKSVSVTVRLAFKETTFFGSSCLPVLLVQHTCKKTKQKKKQIKVKNKSQNKHQFLEIHLKVLLPAIIFTNFKI